MNILKQGANSWNQLAPSFTAPNDDIILKHKYIQLRIENQTSPVWPDSCLTYIWIITIVGILDIDNRYLRVLFLQFFGKRFMEDNSSNDLIKPSESNIILKKKNSEIISALMGLRRAMSNKYDERHIHNWYQIMISTFIISSKNTYVMLTRNTHTNCSEYQNNK